MAYSKKAHAPFQIIRTISDSFKRALILYTHLNGNPAFMRNPALASVFEIETLI